MDFTGRYRSATMIEVSAVLSSGGTSSRSLPVDDRLRNAATGRSRTFQLHSDSMSRSALRTVSASVARV